MSSVITELRMRYRDVCGDMHSMPEEQGRVAECVEPWALQIRWPDAPLRTFPGGHRNFKGCGGSGGECHKPRNIPGTLLSLR